MNTHKKLIIHDYCLHIFSAYTLIGQQSCPPAPSNDSLSPCPGGPMGITALLLAAGFGTRLKPITNTCPKCLVHVGNQPILGDWLDKLEAIGCDKVLVNTHYLNNQVENYLSSRETFDMGVEVKYEPKLLGTAGTIVKNSHELLNDIIIVIHADNFTDMDLSEIVNAHKDRPDNCLMTMLTFTTTEPKSCGIVKKDDNNIVKSFYEKSDTPYGDCANAAIYLFDESLIEEFRSMNNPIDFSTDVIPHLMGRIYSYHTDSIFIDIGTKENLDKARNYILQKSSSINN